MENKKNKVKISEKIKQKWGEWKKRKKIVKNSKNNLKKLIRNES